MSREGKPWKKCSRCGRKWDTPQHAQQCQHKRYTNAIAYYVNGKRVNSSDRSEKEAKRIRREALTDADKGTYVARSKLTVAQFLIAWLLAVKGEVRPSTWATYKIHVETYLIPHLGHIRLQALTRQDIKAYYGKIKASGKNGPLSSKYVHNDHNILHKALKEAVADKLLQHNPADGAHKLSGKGPEMRVWSPSQIRAYLDRVADDRLFAMDRLFVTTGMRRGEVGGLRVCDLDLDAAELTVAQTLLQDQEGFGKPKTDSGRRTIALDPATVSALRAHRAAQLREKMKWGPGWKDSGLVFTREDGSPLAPNGISYRFERQCIAAGLPRIRLHDLRHSYATAALQAGVPAKIVSERLGHKGIAITLDLYSHVLPAMDQEAANKVAGMFDG